MTTANITYGKSLTIIEENFDTKETKIFMLKVGELKSFISGLDCFSIQLSKSVLKKTIKAAQELGFDCEVDESFGFEWEVKMFCNH
jgi:hypothetical protein